MKVNFFETSDKNDIGTISKKFQKELSFYERC